MGDDWAGKFDELGDICEVVYLERTPAISTTAIIEHIADL
jgi:glycerol-3-phosphate cytidylyltransferase